MEHRERRLNVSEGHWAQEDLVFLAILEWELEIAYRQPLDSAQQQGGAPFAWDYQEITVDNSEILAEESAVENLEIAITKAEVLTTGQSTVNLCPAPIASSGFHGQEMLNLYPQTPAAETGDLTDFSAEEEQPDEPPEELVSGPNFSVLCPAPTAVSVELQGTSPAEVLVTGQRVQDLCTTPVAVLEAHGEKVAITSQQPDEGTEKEAASSPPQWQLHSLGGEEFSLLPQRLAEADDITEGMDLMDCLEDVIDYAHLLKYWQQDRVLQTHAPHPWQFRWPEGR
ncbi:hypothetical protein AB205_0199230, partial [Aquarana catesbeiana]